MKSTKLTLDQIKGNQNSVIVNNYHPPSYSINGHSSTCEVSLNLLLGNLSAVERELKLRDDIIEAKECQIQAKDCHMEMQRELIKQLRGEVSRHREELAQQRETIQGLKLLIN